MNKNSKINITLFFQKLEKLYELTKPPLGFLEGNASEQHIQKFKEQFWNQSVVYAWVHKQTFQCYIGSGKQAQKRPFDHLLYEKIGNLNLQQALKEFGKHNFILIILEKVAESNKVTKQQLENAENLYLQKIPRSLQ